MNCQLPLVSNYTIGSLSHALYHAGAKVCSHVGRGTVLVAVTPQECCFSWNSAQWLLTLLVTLYNQVYRLQPLMAGYVQLLSDQTRLANESCHQST